MGHEGLRGIVEAAYRLAVPRSTWLHGLARAAEDALGQSRGTVAALIDATDLRRTRAVDAATTRAIPNFACVLDETIANLGPEYIEDSVRAGADLATESGGMAQAGLRLWVDAFGARDVLTVLAMDATGVGAIIATNLAEPAHADARRSTRLAQLGAHVLGAYRLRELAPAGEEAIFGAGGEVVRADDTIHEAGVLNALANAARALGALRDASSDEARALGRFTSRVDATWSIVAEVDDGTNEWIVAKRNPSSVLPLPPILSQRESQVMSLLLLGRTPKLVAYELGIAHSTVRVLVSRALAKLGVKSVEELRAQRAQPS